MKKSILAILALVTVFAIVTVSFSGCGYFDQEETTESTTEHIDPITAVPDEKTSMLNYVNECLNAVKNADGPYSITRNFGNDISGFEASKDGKTVEDFEDIIDLYMGTFKKDIKSTWEKEGEIVITKDDANDEGRYENAMSGTAEFFPLTGAGALSTLTADDIDTITMIDGYDLLERSKNSDLTDDEKKIEGISYFNLAEKQRIFIINLKTEENPADAQNGNSVIMKKVFDLDSEAEAAVCTEMSKYSDYFTFGGYDTVYSASIVCFIDKLTNEVTSFSVNKGIALSSNEDGVTFADSSTLADWGTVDVKLNYSESYNYAVTWNAPEAEEAA